MKQSTILELWVRFCKGPAPPSSSSSSSWCAGTCLNCLSVCTICKVVRHPTGRWRRWESERERYSLASAIFMAGQCQGCRFCRFRFSRASTFAEHFGTQSQALFKFSIPVGESCASTDAFAPFSIHG
uniref:Uncharacterized protein n=1 Tax=Physcomitrium patens TaxID=3218 RepID=A0A2K1LAE9_PHYPA|nr:hypothetical protein PHYPA_001423 [Physcomitrium patens]